MKTVVVLALLAMLLTYIRQPASAQNTLPFSIELEEVTHSGWPVLHSFAFGKWDGKWVILAGRTNGLHGFFAVTGFPTTSANNQIWILEPNTGNLWSWPVDGFDTELSEPLKATNPQFAQQGKYLYVAGGYGKTAATDAFVTYPSLLAINLETLVPAVVNGMNPEASIRRIDDERLRVCGGEMHELAGYFYLVGGHNFAGLYTENGAPTFTQTYTSDVRRFQISDDGTNFEIENYSAFHDESQYHRRDLNLAPLLDKNGNPGLGAYGGVFRPDADLPYLNPIYITESEVIVDESYEQLMCQYTCPVLPIFDSQAGNMHSVFFGGISLHYWDASMGTLAADSLMPFVRDVSVLSRLADGTTSETVLPLKFDELLGTNAKFVPMEHAAWHDHGVLKLDNLQGRTKVGHIYGGIKALIPNITPSEANKRLFEVYVTPILSKTAHLTSEITGVYAFPNPFSDETSIRLPNRFHPTAITVADSAGKAVFRSNESDAVQATTAFLKSTAPGIYFLHFSDGERFGHLKAVKLR